MRNFIDKWLQWIATVILMSAVALNAFNIFPLNIYISLLGNTLWIIVAYVWRKWSLLITSAIICSIYIVGVIKLWIY